MIEITISKTVWMNTVARKLNPGSAIDVVDYWYDREGSVHLKYHHCFYQYINDHLTAETVAIILGYKSVKFNRDFSITAED
jgi:membrane-associated PAP2 superfamily phosphatase